MAEERWRAEARAAWTSEERRRVGATASRRALLTLTVAAGAIAVGGVGAQIAAGRPPAEAALVAGLTAALLAGLVLGPWLAASRARAAARAASERARAGASPVRCPRCEGALLARPTGTAGARLCGRCGAHLLEAEGLLVVDVSTDAWRARRWRAAARGRLGPDRRRPITTAPLPWLAASVLAVLTLWAASSWLGSRAAPGTVEASFGLGPAGTAHAHDEPAPPGPPLP